MNRRPEASTISPLLLSQNGRWGPDEILPLDENDPWLQTNKKKDAKFDDDLIARIRAKYWPLIQLAKQKYSLSDEQIDQGIRDYLAGKLDEDKLKRIEEIDS